MTVEHPPLASGPAAPSLPVAAPTRVPPAVRGYWLSPAGLVMLAVTGLALTIRLYLLTRFGYLTGITEYDDGVYLGGAVSLLSGGLPYHAFAFVQPPGILLLMAPVALLAKVSAVTTALAAARLLTVLASCVCITLVGALVRHRGAFVTLVACGTLAVYPDDIFTAHTLLLEPWMNLLVLTGVCLAFRDGRLASSRRLLWAGAACGLAGTVKYWAALPALVLLALCVVSRPVGMTNGGPVPALTGSVERIKRAAWFGGGLVAGFAVPVLPFAAPWPGLFLRSTLLDQASRAGSPAPEPLRLAHLTGIADLLNGAGKLAVSGNQGTLFARGDVTATATWADGWLPVAVAALVATGLCVGFTLGRRRARFGVATNMEVPALISPGPGPLEWYALITFGGTLAAVLGYSAFFYHYADFTAPGWPSRLAMPPVSWCRSTRGAP